MESRESALDKAEQVAAEMRSRRLRPPPTACGRRRRDDDLPAGRVPGRAPQAHPHEQHDRAVEQGDPPAHARRGRFPDGNSALMLVCARIRYVTANEWSTRRYLDMSRFDDNLVEAN